MPSLGITVQFLGYTFFTALQRCGEELWQLTSTELNHRIVSQSTLSKTNVNTAVKKEVYSLLKMRK